MDLLHQRVVFDLDEKLTLWNWEAALREYRLFESGEWDPSVKAQGLKIDLSKVEWVEPSAVLRLVLLVEAARLDGIAVEIWLPRPFETSSEAAQIEAARQARTWAMREHGARFLRSVRRRKGAYRMLRKLGFEKVLERADLRLSDGLKIIDVGQDAWSEVPQEGPAFRVVYPLRWMRYTADDDESRRTMVGQIERALQNNWVSTRDVTSLAEIVVQELVENAMKHGNREYALVMASKRYVDPDLMRDEVLPCEQEFLTTVNKEYQLLELLVGDSGLGVQKTLERQYDRNEPTKQWPERDVRSDEILLWAFEKWSSRDPSTRNSPRGLFRVSEIVRRNAGMVTLRSETSYVGRDWSWKRRNPNIADQRGKLAHSPGTAIHVRIPAQPMIAEQSYRQAVRQTTFDLLYFGADQEPFFKQIPAKVRSQALTLPSENGCVIVDLSSLNLDKDAVAVLAKDLTRVETTAAIVIANLSDPTATAGIRGRRAILVRQADGKLEILGAQPPVKDLYDQLSEQGELPLETLRAQYADPAEWVRTLELIDAASHLIQQRSGLFSLKFNRQDVDDAMFCEIERKMQKWIDQLPVGSFVLPNLERTSKLLPIDDLFKTVEMGTAFQALAKQFGGRLRVTSDSVIEIVADYGLDERILRGFERELVEVFGPKIRRRILGPEEKPQFQPGSLILLLTGVVIGGDQVGRLIRQTYWANRFPDAVVTLVDANPSDRARFQYLKEEVKHVIALVERDLTRPAVEGEKRTYMSPVWTREEVAASPQPTEPRRLDLSQEIDEVEALYFGHITRPNGRHFTIYLDAPELFKKEETVAKIGKAVRREVVKWRIAHKIRSAVVVGYPYSDESAALREIASKIVRREKEIIPIRTSVSTSQLRFGYSEHFSANYNVKGKHVVVVDSGVRTGTTIRNLITTAATEGAASLLVVVLFDQMDSAQSQFLTSIKNVQRPGAPNEPMMPVDIRLLQRAAIASYSRQSCPHCLQLRRFADENRQIDPALLRYVKQSEQRLRYYRFSDTGSRDEFRNDERRDAGYGVKVSPEQIKKMVAWRESIMRARDSTFERQSLYNRMSSFLTKEHPEDEVVSLVILLAAEWPWLKKAPLSLLQFKNVLAELAEWVVLDSTAHIGARRSALVLLRTASKKRYAEALPYLVANLLMDSGISQEHQEGLLRQVLYGVHAMLRPGRELTGMLLLLEEQLGECIKQLHLLESSTTKGWVLETIVRLRNEVDIRVKSEDLTAEQAWKRFVDEVDNSGAHNDKLKLLGELFDDARKQANWFERWGKWPACSAVMRKHIDWVQRAEPILKLDNLGGLGVQAMEHVAHVERCLNEFAHGKVIDEERWTSYRHSLNWLWTTVFSRTKKSNKQRSLLAEHAKKRFAHKIAEEVNTAIDAWVVTKQKSDSEFSPLKIRFREPKALPSVYSRSDLIHDLMFELLTNAAKHNRPSAGEEVVPVEVTLIEDEGEHVLLTVRNRGEFRQGGGTSRGGLQLLMRLAAIGAQIDQRFNYDGWTYHAAIRFARWDK